MPVTINGDGSITGLAVGGLPNGSVDADTLASNAVTTVKIADDAVATSKIASNAVTSSEIAANATYACAKFVYSSSSTNADVSGTAGTGQQVPFTHVTLQKNITGDVSNNRWTHSQTGIYCIIIRYRQNNGGDIWSLFGVTKDGNSNCVGSSARTGSEDGHNEAYNVMYTVDSTSSTYQIQGWSGLAAKQAKPGDGQGKPSWTNYDTLVGYTGSNNGIIVDFNIFKVGDL